MRGKVVYTASLNFYVNKKDTTRISYIKNIDSENWEFIHLEIIGNEEPIPGDGEIYYKYNDTFGLIVKSE